MSAERSGHARGRTVHAREVRLQRGCGKKCNAAAVAFASALSSACAWQSDTSRSRTTTHTHSLSLSLSFSVSLSLSLSVSVSLCKRGNGQANAPVGRAGLDRGARCVRVSVAREHPYDSHLKQATHFKVHSGRMCMQLLMDKCARAQRPHAQHTP
jgi:hypothetical protein